MTEGKSGWTVFCSEEASAVLESLPSPADEALLTFFCDFARDGGTAIDAGLPPPGRALDPGGIEYNHAVDDPPAFIQYLVMADIKEFFVTTIVWVG